MNDLEAWFESRLGFLFERQWPKLALTMIDEIKKEKIQLARSESFSHYGNDEPVHTIARLFAQ